MSTQKPDTPFNLSFDQLLAKMNGENPDVETPATTESTPVPATEAHATEAHTPTFEELVAQAQANATPTNSQPVNSVKTPASVVESTPVETPAPTHTPTFEELVAQAQANAKVEPVKEEPVKEEPVKEEPVKEEPVKEEPATTETMNPPETPVIAEKPKETKPAKSTKKSKAAKSKTEVPEDKTEEYRVNLTPAEESNKTEKTTDTSMMDRLFSEEEVAAMRADIRHFVRKEFKLALVDAMKELLTDFNNV